MWIMGLAVGGLGTTSVSVDIDHHRGLACARQV